MAKRGCLLAGVVALALATVYGCAHTIDYEDESATNVYYARLADYKRICQGATSAPEPACQNFRVALIAVLESNHELALANLRGGAASLQLSDLKSKLAALTVAAKAAGAL
jgi:hypothetical protein